MGFDVDDPAKFHRSDGRGLEIVTEPDLRRLADYWRSKREARAMPRREDIDPVDIPWALSRLYIVDYDRERDTYRYRVAGARIEDFFEEPTRRRSLRGATIDDLLPADWAELAHMRWRPLVADGSIVYMRGTIYPVADRVPVGARLLLPLSDGDDSVVTGLMGITDYEWRSRADFSTAPQLEIWHIPLAEIS